MNLPPKASISIEQHPIITRRYILVTPMIVAGINEMIRCIRSGDPSIFFYSMSRFGKTRFRRSVPAIIQQVYPRLPMFSFLSGFQPQYRSDRDFLGGLLRAFRHYVHERGTSGQKMDRLVECAATHVGASGQAKLVLLIDNAECITMDQYNHFANLYDELDERGVELFFFLFGTTELLSKYEELKRTKSDKILNRLMCNGIEFGGIRSLTELRACLGCYDNISRFPENTDWTFSRFFFPDPFERGWRLEKQAEFFWQAFNDVRRFDASIGRAILPMKHFTRIVEQYLQRARCTDSSDPKLEYVELVELVAEIFSAIPKGPATQEEKISDGEGEE